MALREPFRRLWHSKLFWALVGLCALELSLFAYATWAAEQQSDGSWVLGPDERIVTIEQMRKAVEADVKREELEIAVERKDIAYGVLLRDYKRVVLEILPAKDLEISGLSRSNKILRTVLGITSGGALALALLLLVLR